MYWNVFTAQWVNPDVLVNSNIRCIEINIRGALTGLFYKVNSNIRCIEIFLETHSGQLGTGK